MAASSPTPSSVQVLALAPQRLLVVLDEACIEFAGQPSRMPWVQEHSNLVVLRTFSKRAGTVMHLLGSSR